MQSNFKYQSLKPYEKNEILFNVSIHVNFDTTAGIHYSIEQVKMIKAYPRGE